MTQPPPDRAPEEQVSAAFVLPLRAFQPDGDSGFWYVHDANGMEVATCYCDSSGARARAIVAAVNGAAALRARGVADEAAARVVRAARIAHGGYGFHGPHEAEVIGHLGAALRDYDAATRAGDETNKAGEEASRAVPSGGAASMQGGPEPRMQPPSSPATSTAEATAEERAAHVMRAWRDQSSSLRDLETIIGMEIRWLMDALASADRERRGEVAARERALAERDKARAQLHANYGHATRLLLERDAARAKLANDRAAQPARQPAASGEDIALVQRLAADLWHQDFCPWPKFNGDGVSREGECCCDFVEVERRVQEWLAKRLDRFLAARAAAGARP